MIQRRALDTYCCAGGATRGYQQAGFHVTGVDNRPQPHYCGDEFIQADAMDVLADRDFLATFDLIHASPPCQDHSPLAALVGKHGTGWLLAATRERLQASGQLWVIENVPGAPMRPDYKLCGCMFGLRSRKWQLLRERWFETSWHGFDLRSPCHHPDPAVTVVGHGNGTRQVLANGAPTQADRRAAMGIDWMTRDELAQALPVAYTEYIAQRALEVLEAAA